MKNQLENIRVLDLSHVLAGPVASMILGDLGAEIIHIEPPKGDDSREFGPFIKEKSAYFISVNRNKKSVVIDLKKDEGKKILYDLIKISDILIENFKPGTIKKLGFSYEEVKKIKPDIIYASISGFGNDTLPKYRNKPSYDMVVQAYSGLMSITGTEEGEYVRVGTSIGDIIAGHHCAISILTALYIREKTGIGQYIDISMLDSLIYILENAILRYIVTGEIPRPLGTKHPTITPFQGYKTKDQWIIVPIGNDSLWLKLCKAIERNDLIDNPKFKTNKDRTENRTELNIILEKVFNTKTFSEWKEIFEKNNLPYSPINTIDKVVSDPIVKYREMLVELNQPDIGKIKIIGSPFKLSETPGKVRTHAPSLGEHTEEILKNLLNYSEEKIKNLIKKEVIYTYKYKT
ncbi:MAG: CaiB/BaiF CoA transferase family protein [Caldisericia bacterium]